jgi:2,5-diamino-6-(ribosylamino)-4(3H)-pyrimidinone 5'-phosphate reductase
MKTEIIIHNSVSLDGSLTGFMPDMGLHYKIAGDYKPDAHLIGSDTIIKGNEMFGEGIPDELPSDFEQPQRDKSLPWWVIVDSGGKLKGMLHTCRRFEYCRDVIILVTETTPADYLSHLKERKYNFIIAGKEKVDLVAAIDRLRKKYGIARILTDTGRVLGNILLNLGIANEISLLVHPIMVGEKCYPMFSEVTADLKLRLKKSEQFENGCVWMVYSTQLFCCSDVTSV